MATFAWINDIKHDEKARLVNIDKISQIRLANTDGYGYPVFDLRVRWDDGWMEEWSFKDSQKREAALAKILTGA